MRLNYGQEECGQHDPHRPGAHQDSPDRDGPPGVSGGDDAGRGSDLRPASDPPPPVGSGSGVTDEEGAVANWGAGGLEEFPGTRPGGGPYRVDPDDPLALVDEQELLRGPPSSRRQRGAVAGKKEALVCMEEQARPAPTRPSERRCRRKADTKRSSSPRLGKGPRRRRRRRRPLLPKPGIPSHRSNPLVFGDPSE
ncbi:hypothetical protein CRUP_014650 [Coryphaenoides rupestris]|nr:hypothetical protein CRUP_014650 [Coryphaenoides rupestris]